MEDLYRERRPLVKQLLQERPRCEAGITGVCTGKSMDIHEKLTRARLGSILDPANCLAVCRPCHTWIGTHQKEAHDRGLLIHSWEKGK